MSKPEKPIGNKNNLKDTSGLPIGKKNNPKDTSGPSIPPIPQKNESNLTILHPRASPTSTSRLGNLNSMDQIGDFWTSRVEFVFACLLYCLNIGNLWRFPTQVLRYGEGAFVLVYLIISVLFGIPLLFFEVAIGQYTNTGLMNVFHLIPLVQGISYAMVFLSNIQIHISDMIAVYNYIYFFSFARTNAPLSSRTDYGDMCFYENRTNSFENLHFLNEIVMESDDFSCSYNARNLCITFILWLMLWVHTSNEYTTQKNFTMIVYAIVIVSFTITFFATLTVAGAIDGIKRLFSPSWSKFASYPLYVHAFEQTLISLGLGMGPLINFGSYTTFRTPIHIDAITVNICTMIASVLITLIVFGGVGVYSLELGYSDEVLEGQEYYVHVLLAKLFIKMQKGYKNVNIIIFYGAFFISGFFASVKYAELMIQFIHAQFDIHPKYDTRTIFVFCIVQFIISCGMLTHHGFHLLYWSGCNIFTVFSVLTLIAFETAALMYIYRMKRFCEDVEFMVGHKPNWWYKIIWCSTPFVCLVMIVATIVEHSAMGINGYDIFCFIMYIIVVIIPVLIFAIYSSVREMRKGDIRRVFFPAEVQTDFQDYMNWRETASYASKEN